MKATERRRVRVLDGGYVGSIIGYDMCVAGRDRDNGKASRVC